MDDSHGSDGRADLIRDQLMQYHTGSASFKVGQLQLPDIPRWIQTSELYAVPTTVRILIQCRGMTGICEAESIRAMETRGAVLDSVDPRYRGGCWEIAVIDSAPDLRPLIMLALLYLGLGVIASAIYILGARVLDQFRLARLAKERGCQPAQNVAKGGDPIIGLSFLLETIRRAKNSEYMKLNYERFSCFGTTYVNKRLLYETISTIDGENVQEILSTSFDSFEMPNIRIKALSPLFGRGIFTTDGPMWSHHRGLLRPIFNRQNMVPFIGRLERHFELFLKNIPSDGTTVDLRKLFYDFTLDVATEFLVGKSTNTLDPNQLAQEERQFADDYLFCCTEAVRCIQLGPFHWMASQNKSREARDRAWAYIDKYVDQALQLRKSSDEKDCEAKDGGGQDKNLLYELSQDTDNRLILRDQILNVLLASRDTTAALLGNLFFSLARNPEAYAKLRAEVLEVVGGELPTEAHFKSMTWLRWCINESLRIHPVVPLNTRQARKDVTLPVGGGKDGKSPLLVKKGTNVLLNIYSMHRREDVFGPEPEEFRPERWDGLKPHWAYLPFNGGPRICLGQQMALIEASYVITRMAQCFESLEPRDTRPYTEYYTIALFSKNGVQVGLKPAV